MFPLVYFVLMNINVILNYQITVDKFHENSTLDDLINDINRNSSIGWKAMKYDRFINIEHHNSLNTFNIIIDDPAGNFKNTPIISYENVKIILPDTFDSRVQWNDCQTIGIISDESRCCASYAIASVETMANRLCIQSYGQAPLLSAFDVLTCCTYCGKGCHAGYYIMPWNYWLEHGIVTGGPNLAYAGCKPYPYPKCHHHDHNKSDVLYPDCGQKRYNLPECIEKCQSTYRIKYKKDKYYG
ncbi:unnamed protein product, partial [Schistosoma turkestanicum]